MPTKTEIVQLYLAAQNTREDTAIAAVADHIDPGATLSSARGTVEGREAIVDRLTTAPYAAMLGTVEWTPPAEGGDSVTTSCDMPPNPMGAKGMTLTFSFGDHGLITSIVMAMHTE